MTLPTPLEMSALGTSLLLGAAAVAFFLKAIKAALIMAAVGVLLLTSSGVAYGYEEMGADKVTAKLQPQIDDLTAKVEAQRAYAAKLVLEQNSIAESAQKQAKEANDHTIAYFTALLKQAEADAKARATPAPASTVGVLDSAISAANAAHPTAPANGTGESPGTPAAVASESDVALWGVTCAKLYTDASNQVIALQTFYNNLRTAQLKGVN